MFEKRKAKKLGLADRGKAEKHYNCKSCESQLRLGMDINTGALWHWCPKCEVRVSEIKTGPITELYD